eukprot:RCo036647
MSVVPDRAVVAVTGASGFIGSFIVKELLARGFQVRACVRNKDDPEKTEHLRALTREPLCTGTLSLYSADLTHPGSYDDAFRGADAVIHAAAVVEIRRVADPMAQGPEMCLAPWTRAPPFGASCTLALLWRSSTLIAPLGLCSRRMTGKE